MLKMTGGSRCPGVPPPQHSPGMLGYLLLIPVICFIPLLNSSHMLINILETAQFYHNLACFHFFCFFIFFHLPKKRILILQCLEQHMEEKLFLLKIYLVSHLCWWSHILENHEITIPPIWASLSIRVHRPIFGVISSTKCGAPQFCPPGLLPIS